MAHKNAASRRKYRLSENGRAHILLSSAKQRARKCNVVYELDIEWLYKKLEKGVCEMSKMEFTFDPPKAGFHHNPYAPSLDRHDPKKGYTKKNTKLVLWAYNQAKGQWNQKHFRRIMRAIVRNFK